MSRENPTQEDKNVPEQGRGIVGAELPAGFSGEGFRAMLDVTTEETIASALKSQAEDAKAIDALRSEIQSSLGTKNNKETVANSGEDDQEFFDRHGVEIPEINKSPQSPDQHAEESVSEATEVTPKSPADLFDNFANSLAQTNPQKSAHYGEISSGLREEGDKKMMAIEDAILDLEELIGNRFVSSEKNAQYKQVFDELQGEYEKVDGAPYNASAMDRISRMLGSGLRALLRPQGAVGRPARQFDHSRTNPHQKSLASVSGSDVEHDVSTQQEVVEEGVGSTEEVVVEKQPGKQEKTAEMSPDWRTLVTFSNEVLGAHERDTPEDFAKWFTPENEDEIRRYLRAMVRYHVDGKKNIPGATSPDNVASVMDNGANLILQQIMRAKGRPVLGDSETLNMSFSHFAKEYLDMDVRDIDPDYGKYFSPRAGSLPEIYGASK